MKCAQITVNLHISLNLFLQQLVSDIISTWEKKLTFYDRVLKPIACVVLVIHKAADEIKINTIFSNTSE
jgi:hypothetical protein